MTNAGDTRAEIEMLHTCYGRLTGLIVPLDMCRERAWFDWMQKGFGEPELVLVVRFLNRCIRNGDRGFNMGTFKFSRLIEQLDRFQEHLAEARVAARAPGRQIDPNWASVMRATGRDPQGESRNEKAESRKVGEIAAQLVSDPVKAAAELEKLRQLRESL